MSEVINYWPVMVVVEDVYCPQRAQMVLEAMATTTDALIDASAACDGYAAELDAQTRQN
jgi:hypothetical protein